MSTRNQPLRWSLLTAALAALSLTACGGHESAAEKLPPNLNVVRGCVGEGGKPGCFTITDEKDKKTYSFRHPGARAGTYVQLVAGSGGAGDCGGAQIGVTTVTLIREQCN